MLFAIIRKTSIKEKSRCTPFRAFFVCADKSYYPRAIFPFPLGSFHYLIRLEKNIRQKAKNISEKRKNIFVMVAVLTGMDFFPALDDDLETRLEAAFKLKEWR